MDPPPSRSHPPRSPARARRPNLKGPGPFRLARPPPLRLLPPPPLKALRDRRRAARTAAARPVEPFRVVDVAVFYGERSGGIRTYLDAKAAYAQRTGAFDHRLIVPGRTRDVSGARCALPSREGRRQQRLPLAARHPPARRPAARAGARRRPAARPVLGAARGDHRRPFGRGARRDGPSRLARSRRRGAPRPEPRSTGPR